MDNNQCSRIQKDEEKSGEYRLLLRIMFAFCAYFVDSHQFLSKRFPSQVSSTQNQPRPGDFKYKGSEYKS